MYGVNEFTENNFYIQLIILCCKVLSLVIYVDSAHGSHYILYSSVCVLVFKILYILYIHYNFQSRNSYSSGHSLFRRSYASYMQYFTCMQYT